MTPYTGLAKTFYIYNLTYNTIKKIKYLREVGVFLIFSWENMIFMKHLWKFINLFGTRSPSNIEKNEATLKFRSLYVYPS